jgi:glycosyltransferase involved in cell wall biosynthesis
MLTVVVLTYNEELHISRCLSALRKFGARLVVVDSFSTDRTVEIAEAAGADIYLNKFINQAAQFQWAMNNCSINSEWVLRLDADETIDSDLVENINKFIVVDGYGHNGQFFIASIFF